MRKKEMRIARARMKARQKRNRKNHRNRQNSVSRMSIIGVLLICVAASLVLSYGAMAGESNEIPITLRTEDVSILQGETKPVFRASATCSGDTSVQLDEETGYTIQDLLDELNQGIGYTLECDADGNTEGKFPIKAELTSEITTPLYAEWFGKVKINTESGTLQVKNQYGEWKDGKFRRWDGTWVTEDFITYRGSGYYFDKDGNKVTGWQDIRGARYHFSKKGVMKTGWMDEKDDRYYFDDTGMMYCGWLTLDGDKYYFDEEGKMLTGEQKIGTKKCVFAKDGKLESEEGGVNPEKPMVALTFDDGPGPRTSELLDALEEHNARATFFMLGQKVSRYQDTVKKMMEIGCELGNHSYDHTNLSKVDGASIQKQIQDTNNQIAGAAGQKATVMRPPYGAINSDVESNVGMPMILWSIDTLDWKTRNAQSTIENVMSNVKDGDVILMHDIHTESVDAAIQLITKLQDAGYQLVTVSEMAEARGITLENGGKYGRMAK